MHSNVAQFLFSPSSVGSHWGKVNICWWGNGKFTAKREQTKLIFSRACNYFLCLHSNYSKLPEENLFSQYVFFSSHPLTSSCSNHTPDTSFPSLVSMMHFAIDFLFISKKTNGNDKRKKTKFRSVIISSPLKVIVSHGTTLSLFTHSGNLENRGNVCYRWE